jgi:hypothetical protein
MSGLRSRRRSMQSEMDLALLVLAGVQRNIEQADSKVSMLLVVNAGLMAVQVQFWQATSGREKPLGMTAEVLLVLSVVLLSSATYCLAQVLRPRHSGPPGTNRLAFPSLARGTDGNMDESIELAVVPKHAWDVARRLAIIAEIKFTWVTRAVWVLAVASLLTGIDLLLL